MLERVVDGDTVRVSSLDGQDLGRVRLIGFDAPEIDRTPECWGNEATERLIEMLPDRGERLTLVPDGAQGNRDRYGRLLRFVRVDGVDIGREMVAAGAARADKEAPASYAAAERAARQMGRGLWGACPDP